MDHINFFVYLYMEVLAWFNSVWSSEILFSDLFSSDELLKTSLNLCLVFLISLMANHFLMAYLFPKWLNNTLSYELISSDLIYIYIYIYIYMKQLHKNVASNTEKNPWGSTPQSSSCTATYHPSRKLSKLDELYIWDTAGEVGTNSQVMCSWWPVHMDEQRQNDLLEPTSSSSMPIQDVVLNTCRKQWTKEKGERKV